VPLAAAMSDYPSSHSLPSFAIIGFGSIARKHLQSIRKIAPSSKVSILTSQNIDQDHYDSNVNWHRSIDTLLQAMPDFVMVATPAGSHGEYLDQLRETKCTLLIEKPLAATLKQARRIMKVAKDFPKPPLVAYNLRFAKLLDVMHEALVSQLIGEVHSVHTVVGQDLNQWRPGRNISGTVSASRNKGGGVLRELSHEIDYLYRLFGPVQFASAMLGCQKFAEFDVEDTAMLHLRFRMKKRDILASVNMDFTRQDTVRSCHVIGSHGTLRWDLIGGRITLHGATSKERLLVSEPSDLARTNETMWRACLAGQFEKFTTIAEAVMHLKWIETMEAEWAQKNV